MPGLSFRDRPAEGDASKVANCDLGQSIVGDKTDTALGVRLGRNRKLANGFDDIGDRLVVMRDAAFELVEFFR